MEGADLKLGSESRGQYDIVIVGGGAAGCTVANNISNKYSVLLLDRASFPREKTCGGLLSPEAQNFLKDTELPNHIFSNPRYLCIRRIDWDNGEEISETEQRICNISRKDFDYWLLSQKKDHVNFLTETKLLGYQEKLDGISVFIERNREKVTIRAKYIIGADGALSPIRRSLRDRQIRYYVAIQQWIKSDACLRDSLCFIYDSEITDFYCWAIPKDNYIVMGAALKPGSLEEKMRVFNEKLTARLGVSGAVFRRDTGIGLRPQSTDDIIFGNGNVLLVGEAAGLICPTYGDGISFALRSGYNCALALNSNFESASKHYKKLCSPLIEEIEDKIKKAEILSDPAKRRRFFTLT